MKHNKQVAASPYLFILILEVVNAKTKKTAAPSRTDQSCTRCSLAGFFDGGDDHVAEVPEEFYDGFTLVVVVATLATQLALRRIDDLKRSIASD